MMKARLVSCALAVCLPFCQAQGNSSFLTATSIVTNAQNHSAFQCWEFSSPLNVSSSAGISGAATYNFANVEEAEYTVIPTRFNGGIHNAPAPQIVVFMSGLAHITLPYPASRNSSLNEAWVAGGAEGLIVAVDTIGTGHITTYPLDVRTVSLQIPFKENIVPAHRVLYEGPCHYADSSGQTSSSVLDTA